MLTTDYKLNISFRISTTVSEANLRSQIEREPD